MSTRENLVLRLRPVQRTDLNTLYEMQSDPASNAMAGTKPRPREVFFAVWDLHFQNPKINGRVIEAEVGGAWQAVGSIACFQVPAHEGGELNCVGYWIARAWWGRGVASRALPLFLEVESRRPLHATAASSNTASRRILERCGFRCVNLRMGEETDRYVAREVAEFVLET